MNALGARLALRTLLLAAALGLGTAPAAAAPVPAVAVEAALPLAERFTWEGFVDYWTHSISGTSQVVRIVLLVAALALFIITRGKWMR